MKANDVLRNSKARACILAKLAGGTLELKDPKKVWGSKDGSVLASIYELLYEGAITVTDRKMAPTTKGLELIAIVDEKVNKIIKEDTFKFKQCIVERDTAFSSGNYMSHVEWISKREFGYVQYRLKRYCENVYMGRWHIGGMYQTYYFFKNYDKCIKALRDSISSDVRKTLVSGILNNVYGSQGYRECLKELGL